jgi:ADP-ribose pyrophosphatase
MLQESKQLAIWEVIQRKAVLEHPFLTVDMEMVRLPGGEIIPEWPKVYSGDFVNAVVLNEKNEVMILEGYKHGLEMFSWQVVGGYLEEGEDPVTAVQRELLEETGYQAQEWLYLGSFIQDANRYAGIGHYFCARKAVQIAEPCHNDLEAFGIKWVPLKDLKYALLDGRISGSSYAINVALALLML